MGLAGAACFLTAAGAAATFFLGACSQCSRGISMAAGPSNVYSSTPAPGPSSSLAVLLLQLIGRLMCAAYALHPGASCWEASSFPHSLNSRPCCELDMRLPLQGCQNFLHAAAETPQAATSSIRLC